jgi:hypothetical protein
MLTLLDLIGKQGRANHLHRQPRLQGTWYGAEPAKEGVTSPAIIVSGINGFIYAWRGRALLSARAWSIICGESVEEAGVYGASREGQDFVSYTSAQHLSMYKGAKQGKQVRTVLFPFESGSSGFDRS